MDNNEVIFSQGNYSAHVCTDEELVDLGDGQFGNYVVTNTATGVEELLVSTLNQAKGACLQLSRDEQALQEAVNSENAAQTSGSLLN